MVLRLAHYFASSLVRPPFLCNSTSCRTCCSSYVGPRMRVQPPPTTLNPAQTTLIKNQVQVAQKHISRRMLALRTLSVTLHFVSRPAWTV